MNTFKKIQTIEITPMSDMGTKHEIVKGLLYSIFTSCVIYKNSREEAFY